MDWLETHAAMTLWARERRIRHPSQTSNDGLLNVKENLHALFATMSASSSSSSSRSGRIFGLCHPQKGGIYTLILVSSIRLDLSAHTVVADAHILPLSQSVIRGITRFLQDHQKDVRTLLASDEGITMWKMSRRYLGAPESLWIQEGWKVSHLYHTRSTFAMHLWERQGFTSFY